MPENIMKTLWDESDDLQKAADNVMNAKTQRVGV